MSKASENSEAGWRNGHATVSYEALEELTGEPREVWDRRIWEMMDEFDLMFVISAGPGRSNGSNKSTVESNTGSRLHLPREFPNQIDAFDREPNEKTTDMSVVKCRKMDTHRYVFKHPAVYPPGFKDVCGYCLYEFSDWWDKQQKGVFE